MPVWYRPSSGASGSRSLEVDCLVPRRVDVAYHLSQGRRVVLIVPASSGVGLRWLPIQGTVRPVEAPDWGRLLPRLVSTLHPDAICRIQPGTDPHLSAGYGKTTPAGE